MEFSEKHLLNGAVRSGRSMSTYANYFYNIEKRRKEIDEISKRTGLINCIHFVPNIQYDE